MNRKLFLLLIAYLAFVLLGVASNVINVAWSATTDNSIQTTFGVGSELLGVLLFAATLGGLVSAFFAGRVIVRFGINLFVLFGTALGAISLFAYALAPTWGLMLVAALIGGLGSGAIDSGFNTFVAANYSAGRVNWLHAAFGIGATVSPTFVTFLVVQGGQAWRMSYLLLVIPALVVFGLALLNLRHWTLPAQPQEIIQLKPASALETLRIPVVAIGIPLFFLYGGVEFGAGQLAYNLLTSRGIDPSDAGIWVSAYWGSFTVGRIFMGVIADLFSPRLLLRGTMVGMLGGLCLLWANVSPTMNLISLLVTGISVAPMFPIFISQTPTRIGQRHAPNAIGFQIAATMLGIALVPGFGGVLISSFGEEAIPVLLIACAIGVALLYEVMLARESRQLALGGAGD